MFHVVDEVNIPVPPVNAGGGRSPKYPFREMEVGDIKHFLADSQEVKRIQRAAAAFCRRNKGVKFITRSTDQGVRVWREA